MREQALSLRDTEDDETDARGSSSGPHFRVEHGNSVTRTTMTTAHEAGPGGLHFRTGSQNG